jgi:hypothetical protein
MGMLRVRIFCLQAGCLGVTQAILRSDGVMEWWSNGLMHQRDPHMDGNRSAPPSLHWSGRLPASHFRIANNPHTPQRESCSQAKKS